MSNDLSLTLEIQLTHDLNVFIRRIHDSPVRLVLAITGGGSRAISELLEVPGGSRTLLEAVVPYSAAALDAWLGGRPWRYCDQATARAMAMAAFQRGRRLSEGTDVAGVGATASLMSDAPKRGPHRVHVAMQTAGASAAWSLELIKDRRTRPEEELLASRLILNAVAEAAGLVDRLSLDLLEGEQVQAVRIAAPPGWRRLLLAEQSTAGPLDRPDAAMAAAGGQRAIFPGAFNPLHDGHKGMARVAQEMLGMAVEHEISIFNVDKPPLAFWKWPSGEGSSRRMKGCGSRTPRPSWRSRRSFRERRSSWGPIRSNGSPSRDTMATTRGRATPPSIRSPPTAAASWSLAADQRSAFRRSTTLPFRQSYVKSAARSPPSSSEPTSPRRRSAASRAVAWLSRAGSWNAPALASQATPRRGLDRPGRGGRRWLEKRKNASG